MGKIIKSYLKQFMKSWIETLGFLVFLILFCVMSFSMIGTPLRVTMQAQALKSQTNVWDGQIEMKTHDRLNSKAINAIYDLDPNSKKSEIDSLKLTNPSGENINITWEDLMQYNDKKLNGFLTANITESIDILVNVIKGEYAIYDDKYCSDDSTNASVQICIDFNDELTEKNITIEEYVEKVKGRYTIEILDRYLHSSKVTENQENGYMLHSLNEAVYTTLHNFGISNEPQNEEELNKQIKCLFVRHNKDYFKENDFKTWWKFKTPTNKFFNESISEIINDDFYRNPYMFLEYQYYNTVLKRIDPNGNGFNNSSFKNSLWIWLNKYVGNSTISAYVETIDQNEDDKLNNLILTGGRLPDQNEVISHEKGIFTFEAVVNEKYLKDNNLKIGDNLKDSFTIGDVKNSEYGEASIINFKIVGTGYRYSSLNTPKASGLFDDVERNSVLFINGNSFKEFLNEKLINYENDTKTMILKQWFFFDSPLMSEVVDYLETPLDKSTNITNITPWKTKTFEKFKSMDSVKTINDFKINTIIYSIIGVVLFSLSFVFIIYIQKREIYSIRKQLGVFKALGYESRQLSVAPTIKTLIVLFVGVLLGYLISIPWQIDITNTMYKDKVVFEISDFMYEPIFLLIILVIVPLLFSLFSYVLLTLSLNEGAISLMQGEASIQSKNPTWYLVYRIIFFPVWILIGLEMLFAKMIANTRFAFTFRLQGSFAALSRGKFITVMTLFGFSTFLICVNVKALPTMQYMVGEAISQFGEDTDHVYDNKLELYNVEQDENNNSYIESSYTEEKVETGESTILFHDLKGQNAVDYLNSKNMLLASAKVDAAVKMYEQSNNRSVAGPALFVWALLSELDDNEITLPSKWEWPFKPLFDNQQVNKNALFSMDYKQAIEIDDIFRLFGMAFGQDVSNINVIKDNIILIIEAIKNPPVESKASMQLFSEEVLSLLQMIAFSSREDTPILTWDQYLYDSGTDALVSAFDFLEEEFDDDTELILADVKYNKFGDIRRFIKMSNVSDSQWQSLATGDVNKPNIIISERMARALNKKVGDEIIAYIGYGNEIKADFKIVGINKADGMMGASYVDYNSLIKSISNPKTKDEYNLLLIDENKEQQEHLVFNRKYSSKESVVGKFDINDPLTSLMNLKSKETVFTKFGEQRSAWMGNYFWLAVSSLIDDQNTLHKIQNYIVFGEECLVENPTEINREKQLVSSSAGSDVFANEFGIYARRSATDIDGIKLQDILFVRSILVDVSGFIVDFVTESMIMNMIVSLVLLTILFIVLIKIIITDSMGIIRLMRSFGYRNWQISWIVIGKYFTTSVVIFLISYVLASFVWLIVGEVIWQLNNIIIVIPSTPWLPFLIFIIMESIIGIGFITGMLLLRKMPLTRTE